MQNRAVSLKSLCLITGFVIAFLGSCSLSGAVTRPDASEYQRSHSRAIPQDSTTALGRHLMPLARRHPGESGFYLLPNGSKSFDMRLALVQAADKTLDLQYYLMNDDLTASLLLEGVLRAAARGVRVRFLIDNINVDDVSRTLSVLDGNKNIEVRVFNPMTTKDQSPVSQFFGLFTNLGRATKRMHNKALIADNQLAIIGGRNLGDEYFDADKDTAFSDLDILSAGPVTNDISKSFDRYWNSDDSFPISALHAPVRGGHVATETRRILKENWDEVAKTEAGKRVLTNTLGRQVREDKIKLVWARAELAVDDPEKIRQDKKDAASPSLNWIEALADRTKKEFLIVSAYFVPQDDGVAWLSRMTARGVNVRVLTNSLSSTDVVAVHTGYERYRRDLIDNNIDLYELKNTGNKRPRQRLFGSKSPPYANLHSKVYVFDRQDVVIGSFNLDPRSIELNTEISLVIHSTVLADEIARLFEISASPENSYRLVAGDTPGGILWLTKDKGRDKKYKNDPKAGFGRELQVFFMSWLPIEDQL